MSGSPTFDTEKNKQKKQKRGHFKTPPRLRQAEYIKIMRLFEYLFHLIESRAKIMRLFRLVLNIFFIWRSLYPYNSIFYDLSPPSPIHNVEDILFSKKCGLVSLQQHCFRGEGGSKYKVSKIFAPDCCKKLVCNLK